MNIKNTLQKAGRALYHQSVDINDGILEPGIYETPTLNIGGAYVPGFRPIAASNDKPFDICPIVSEMSKEIKDFFSKIELYKSFGFAHKRGYLLHGPPGTGKSSALRLIQSQFVAEFGGVVLVWAGGQIEDHYEAVREHEAEKPIMVVCEDLDSTIDSFETRILEFLDGQKGLHKFVLIATTNYLDQIPERIRNRPSRIDRLIEIGFPSIESRTKYLKTLNIPDGLVEEIAQKSQGLSIAHLKEIVIASICLGTPIDEIVKRLGGGTLDAGSFDSAPKQLELASSVTLSDRIRAAQKELFGGDSLPDSPPYETASEG